MSIGGTIFLLVVIAAIFLIIFMVLSSGNPRQGSYGRIRLYENITTGDKGTIAPDYVTPEDFNPKKEPNTGKLYITLESGGFFKKKKRQYLTDQHMMVRYEGYTQIYDGLEYFNSFAMTKIVDQDKKILELKNIIALEKAKRAEIETDFNEELKKQIGIHEDMKKAAAIVIKDKK